MGGEGYIIGNNGDDNTNHKALVFIVIYPLISLSFFSFILGMVGGLMWGRIIPVNYIKNTRKKPCSLIIALNTPYPHSFS